MADAQPVHYEDGTPIPLSQEDEGKAQIVRSRTEVWNPATSAWEKMVQPTGGGGSSGGLTDTQLRATPVPVSGSFYPATQPVSGTVSVSNLPATQPVSGTVAVSNLPATQPVSAAALPLPAGAAQEHSTAASPASARLSDGAAYLSTTSGRLDVQVGNFPASQAVTGPLTDTQLRAAAVPVSGPVTDAQLRASAVPVSGPLTDTQLRASAVPVSGPLTDAQLRAAVVPVRNAPDAGRSQVMLSWEEMAGTAAAESTLTNFTLGARAGAALTAATNLQVTAGKTLRINVITVYVKATSTVNNLARFRVRQAATVAATSPVIFDTVLGLELGTVAAGALHSESYPIPDGLEVAAGQQITFTWFTAANTCTVGLSLVGFEY